MYRRRRRLREIPFSFDSFLDIVANVVGIIIRLILVVWVGARSYSSLQSSIVAEPPAAKVAAEPAQLTDPLQSELAQQRLELDRAQTKLLEQLRLLQDFQVADRQAEKEWQALLSSALELQNEKTALARNSSDRQAAAERLALSSAEIRRRSLKLAEEIRALEQTPPPSRVLHYRTPVSRPLQSEELLFECKQGRVAFIDIAALLREVQQSLDDKAKLLRTEWEVQGITGPLGPFRLRYTVERERGLLDSISETALPDPNTNFRYGMTGWQVEPVALNRGETLQAALAENSEFRQIVDGLDPQQSAVTFFVYPESFALFRRLRDYLYDQDIVVAGRPLPDGVPIASSRRGTISRGQ
jgi:hypothetical protein